MNLYHLRYFIELVHTRHYTKAAARLGITQPSLSHAISQLENELGVPLFERSGRNTSLTRFGEEFLAYAENSLSILDNGIESLKHSARGNGLIRLGFLRPLGVEFIPSLAAGFLQQHPELDIDFIFRTGSTSYLLDGLAAKDYDLIFSSQVPEEYKEYHLTSEPVSYQDLVVIVPKNHPLAGRRSVSLEETLPYPYIYFAKGAGIRSDVNELFRLLGEKPSIAYEVEEDQVIAGLVARNFGIAIVPYMDLLLRLDVQILTITNPVYKRKIYMVSSANSYLPPAVQLFREYVTEQDFLGEGEGKIVL